MVYIGWDIVIGLTLLPFAGRGIRNLNYRRQKPPMLAHPNGRVMPLKWEEYNYGPFFAVLRQIHYDRLISLEVSNANLAVEGPQAIALLRRAFGE